MAVGFIGLGIMGSGMAANLLDAGRDIVVWNRTADRMDPFIERGAASAASPGDVAERCDIVFVCVSDTPDVEAVVQGDGGLLGSIGEGSLIVDHSSISPVATVRLAELISDRGGGWLDAPVSGGSEGAQRGTLSVMVGGAAADLERTLPYLQAYTTTITHVGPVGSGQQVKIVNQILVVINQLAVSEALLFAQQAGLDLQTTIDAIKDGAAGSWMLSNRGPQMVVRDWRPGFSIDLQQKDLRLALEAADEIGVPLAFTAQVYQLYRTLQHRGLGHEGNHALVKALEELSGINLAGS